MKRILKRIIYWLLLRLEQKTADARIYRSTKMITIGEGSHLYPESIINNFKGDVGNIVIGKNTHIRGELTTMIYGGKIEIGDNCFVGQGSRIWSGELVKLGSNILISHNVHIMDTDTHELNHIERAAGYVGLIREGQPANKGNVKTAPVIIEDYAWVCFNVIILKGVKVGKGAVLAAGSVVTKDVPEFSLVTGNPAKVIRSLKSVK